MYLVFMDGCDVPAPARAGLGPLRAIGGVLVPESEVAGFDTDLRRIRREAGLAASDRIGWAAGAALSDRDRRLHVHTTVLAAAMRREIASVVVVADSASRAGADREELVRTFLGRVAVFLQERGEIAVVVADPADDGLSQIARELAEVPADPDVPYPPETRIVLPVLSAPSRHVPHLQLASLVVGATTAVVAGQPEAAPVAPLLTRLMARRIQHTAGGAGLVLQPERYNILHWGFGERWHYDPTLRQRVQLPHRDWDYGTSDGLPPAAHQTVA
ncbi:hypothetical protein GCM10009765_71220 [Fodinicola feengrottensis]|uniref:DUF3800 domain-containing protein n=1 Tax=Fodinicola feengrottensis TaxID=435914 RepID=A0ABN2IUS8_9ACTN